MCHYHNVFIMNTDAGHCAKTLACYKQSCAGQNMAFPPSTSEQISFFTWHIIKSLGEV